MLYIPLVSKTEAELREAWQGYLAARAKVINKPVARAGVNLTWQGWLGKYRWDHNPIPTLPVTQAMIDDIASRCPPMPETMTFHPTDPPPWINPKPGVEHHCRICDGIFHYGEKKTAHQRPVNGATFADAENGHDHHDIDES